jgi:ubiquinone/menaquinone biosynthesis C-methylase UbiE
LARVRPERLDLAKEEARMPTFVATDPAGYEKYVGRWSQRLAPAFVEFSGVSAGERVLDVGCGTGNLTAALGAAKVAAATGIDLSAPYIEYARQRVTDSAVVFKVGDALSLPYPDDAFDRALSMLALDVLPDPTRALAEMRRVTRPGGAVAALVNDFRCGYAAFSMLWDTAAALDPRAGEIRDEMVSKPMGWPGGLAALYRAAGLVDPREDRISTLFEYASFEDYWSSFLTGQGKTGSYVTSLADGPREELEGKMRAVYLCGMPPGPRAFTNWFWVARGEVPRSSRSR